MTVSVRARETEPVFSTATLDVGASTSTSSMTTTTTTTTTKAARLKNKTNTTKAARLKNKTNTTGTIPKSKPSAFLSHYPSPSSDMFFYAVLLSFFFGSVHLWGHTLWATLVETYSPRTLVLGGTFLISQIGFWTWVSLLSILDLYQFPRSFWRYKLQPTKIPEFSWYKKAVWVVLRNQFLVGLPTGVGLFYLMRWRGNPMGLEDLPTLRGVAWESLGFLMVEEVGFYYGHRLLHHPRIYKYVHKVHHEFTAPIGIAAIYCHPFEHFICNLSPLLLGPVLMKSHILTLWLWITIGQTNAINSHCGFHLPLFPSPVGHDYHHETFNKNFGPVGVLDWLHGTAGSHAMAEEKKRLKKLQELDVLDQDSDHGSSTSTSTIVSSGSGSDSGNDNYSHTSKKGSRIIQQ